MESQDLTEEIEREARRVAAAFEVGQWEKSGQVPFSPSFAGHYYQSNLAQLETTLYCIVNDLTCQVIQLDIDDTPSPIVDVRVHFSRDHWDLSGKPKPQLQLLMARGLYRLGFEDEAVSKQLSLLSMHEKLELRLSMPREFWPQKWLDEERA